MAIDISNIKQNTTDKKKEKTEGSGFFDFLNKDLSFSKNQLNDKKKERFYSELSILIHSGIDLAQALDIIVKQEKNKKALAIYEGLLDQMVKGDSFSECLKKAGVFTDYEYYSIMIGEESGTITTILEEIAKYFKTRLKQKRQVLSALTYPIMVMVVAFGVVLFMLNVIVPMFAGVFQRFGGELPALTQKIVALSDFFADNIVKIILFIAVFVGIILYIKRFDFYRKVSTSFLLKLPVFGALSKKIHLARFCSTLQLLIGSQAPIIDSLDLIGKMIRFYPLNTAIEGIRQGLAYGKSLNGCMEEYKIFDLQMISLIKVGEETGKLGHILKRLEEQYTEEIEYRTAQMGSLLEPLLIIGVGIMVMVILIAMYLPMFQLSTSIM